MLWSTSSILVRKTAIVDIRSVDGIGPGANDDSCPDTVGTFGENSDPVVGTGGCGGPFGTAGGNGGDGNVAGKSTVSIQCSEAAVALDRVRGGCAGGAGGIGIEIGQANGGSSAGAIYLMAATSITVAGAIDARGTPGDGGPGIQEAFVGGGGGGSGGLVGLDAPDISLEGAVLNALGGGGGSGGGLAGVAQTGFDGEEATLDPPTNATSTDAVVSLNFGGATGSAGGAVGSNQTGGGGGGGGAAGYIVVLGRLEAGAARFAPPITPL